jgi:prolyl-tRNA synthetase
VAAAEQRHDANGLSLPPAIAPFEVIVVPVNVGDATQRSAAEDIDSQAREAGFDVLLDDRDERPGVKFKDADLIGVPFRVTVGKKVTTGMVEVRDRSTGQTTDVNMNEIVEFLRVRCRARDSGGQRG